MKIAMVSPYISTAEDLTYYQSQQINLAVELVKPGIQVDIITLMRSSDHLAAETIIDGLNIYRLPLLSQLMKTRLRQPVMNGLWKQLKKGNYDFVQSSDDFTLSTLSAAVYALFHRTRLIIYQGVYAYSNKRLTRLLMMIYDLFANPLLRFTYCTAVCKTNRARQYLKKKNFQKVRVIPIGVNISTFYPEKAKHTGTYELLAVGSLIPRKNYSFLLDVFQRLNSINSRARLTIIGSGPEEFRILNYINQYNLTGKVVLLKSVPNSQMRHYYSKSDLTLLFSTKEIFGMVILESMACGCPVMSTPTPGALDVISDNINGFIAGEQDPEKIALRINSVIEDRGRLKEVRKAVLRTVAEKYSWPKIAKQYHDLYLEQSDETQ